MSNKSFPVTGNLGYGPDINISVGEPDGSKYTIIMEVRVGGETNGAASIQMDMNYLDPVNFTLIDSLIDALTKAKAEAKKRWEDHHG